jgi:serine/threonine protein kinase
VEPEPDISPHHIGGFRVLRRLASGATTDVLLARAEGPHGFERVVALKVLLQQFRSDPAFERMFAREASAYARLSHPAIVKLYDFFAADGQLVMVLEYIDGLPLHKLRAMLSIGGERLDDTASLFIGSRIFAALAAAHSARDPENGEFSPVTHRDINPSNVLVPWDGHVKISDFGIAKIGNAQGDTRLGFVKGTYGYMAPEQVRGEVVTVRADVYAATLVLWELLARRKAIQRGALPEVEVLKAMAKPEFPTLDTLRPDLPSDIREAIRRGLEPNPDRRAITADEMSNILRRATKGDEGRAMLAEAIARVRPVPTSEGLAVTQAHPTHPSLADILAADPPSGPDVGSAEAGKGKGPAQSARDPDATQPFNVQELPEDSGAFKRAEVAQYRPAETHASPQAAPKAEDLEDLLPADGVDEPKSLSDLTLIEPHRPGTSDPPPTTPPSSEPGTVPPTTLSLPASTPRGDWRSSSLGVVRTEASKATPETLRFGAPASEEAPAVAAPTAPPPSSPIKSSPPGLAATGVPASQPPASSRSGSKAGPPSSPRPEPPRPATRPPRPAGARRDSPRPAPLPFTSLTGGPTPSESLITTKVDPSSKADSPSGSQAAGPASPRERTLVSPGAPSSSPASSVRLPDAPTLIASVAPPPESASSSAPVGVGAVAPQVEAPPVVSPAASAPAPSPTASNATQTRAPNPLVVPTVKVPRSVAVPDGPPSMRGKRSEWFLILGVVVVSAVLGVVGVEVYVRSVEPTSAVGSVSPMPSTSSAPPSRPPPAPMSSVSTTARASTSAFSPAASAASSAASPAHPSVATSASASASAAPVTNTATPAGTDADAAAAGLGSIFTDPTFGSHRIFIEGRVVGESPGPVQVRCGTRSIQVGSAGVAKDVSVPCGGSILVTP